MTTPAGTAANTNATMEGQYQFVQDLVGSVPELANIVKQASAQGASADAFQAMLESTNWWRTNANTARSMVALQASDPATYQQQINQAQQHVQAIAAQMGVPLTTAQVASFATADLYQGLNDDQLKANLGGTFSATSNPATATGDAASYTQTLQQLALSYGVPVTSSWINGYVQTALSTGQSQSEMAASATQNLITSATSAYPTLGQQLLSGQTTEQIAQPYIAAMSNTLEIPDTGITVNDPLIQQALTNPSLTPGTKAAQAGSVTGNTSATSASTANQPSTAGTTNQPGATTMPLYQFQNMLRQDPRWQQTDNAKQSAYSMVASLGKSFGFAS